MRDLGSSGLRELIASGNSRRDSELERLNEKVARLEAWRRGKRRLWLLLSPLPLLGIAAAGAIAMITGESRWWAAAAPFALVLLVLLSGPERDAEASEATRLRDVLSGEPDQIGRAIEIGEGRAFALFLRSFDAELAGEAQLKRDSDLLGQELHYQQQVSGLSFPPSEDMLKLFMRPTARNLQASLLQALSVRLPTVYFSNVRLESAAAAIAGVTELTMMTSDWEAVFAFLAKRARVTVVLADVASPALLKEAAYLHAEQLPFVVVGRNLAPTRGALATLSYDDPQNFDPAPLVEALDRLLC